jgi:aminobenzoyl-glutamate transport protein
MGGTTGKRRDAVMTMKSVERRGWLDRVERAGNALPDPVFIFLFLIGLLILWSVIAAGAGWSAVNPTSGETLTTQSLLSEKNLARLFTDMPQTMVEFPPLGLLLVVMLGASVAERAGLFAALIGQAVRRLPKRMLTPATFFISLLSHQAADAAYVVLIPLAAIVYREAGRHPLAGIAIAYAGISGAFAGNLVPGQFDVLILGITNAAARILAPDHILNPLGNWWFTAAFGLSVLPVAWYLTDRVVEPRLRAWTPDGDAVAFAEPLPTLGAPERKGLIRAGIAALMVVALFVALTCLPGFTPLIDESTSGPARLTPFYRALIAGFAILFVATGWAYGAAAGTVKDHRAIVSMMAEGMRSMAPFLVIAFFAAHFIAMFAWSNLGPVMAINGAAWLKTLAMPTGVLLVLLLMMSAVFDLFIGSASAKWSAIAPVVVPLLMLLGISPEMTTAAYRMGDSVFNIVTPVASNFVLVLIFCQRWVKGFGIGSLIAMMLPYSMSIALIGLTLVGVWTGLELPVGPGAGVAYQLVQP